MCTPHVPRIAAKPQEVACRWLFDMALGVILFDKSILHDPPLFVVDSASRWLEVATVVKKGGDNKILAEFRGMLRNFE
jgi:hypothetical protein